MWIDFGKWHCSIYTRNSDHIFNLQVVTRRSTPCRHDKSLTTETSGENIYKILKRKKIMNFKVATTNHRSYCEKLFERWWRSPVQAKWNSNFTLWLTEAKGFSLSGDSISDGTRCVFSWFIGPWCDRVDLNYFDEYRVLFKMWCLPQEIKTLVMVCHWQQRTLTES